MFINEKVFLGYIWNLFQEVFILFDVLKYIPYTNSHFFAYCHTSVLCNINKCFTRFSNSSDYSLRHLYSPEINCKIWETNKIFVIFTYLCYYMYLFDISNLIFWLISLTHASHKIFCILSRQNVETKNIKYDRDTSTCSHSRFFFSLLSLSAPCFCNRIFLLKFAL